MRVQDIMTTGVKTIAPRTSAEDALNAMKVAGVHHLVVTDRTGIQGVISSHDLGGARDARVRKDFVVADLMSEHVLTIAPAATLREAANVMRGHSVGCLVVTDGSQAVGIVTISDLLELIGRGFDRGVANTERRLLNHRVPHQKKHRPVGTW
jgi:CBS-domain-containing membrane protein